MKYIEIKAPAKINIGLNIINKRLDGYHNLYTLFYPIYDLYDTLKFTLSERFEFFCNDKNIPDDENNLVVKAKLLLEELTKKSLYVKIELEKVIPSQAGLGGGSSDAAATLISLNELFRLNLKDDELNRIALMLGSDVPFFIKAKPAIGKSRGEILEHIDLEINEYIVIVNPGINISTREAFANAKPVQKELDFRKFIIANKIDYNLLREIAFNDFEEFAFNKYPEIENIKKIFYESGALYASMSGSGSTVFGIFSDEAVAKKSIQSFPKTHFCWISNPHY
ncbi:MAG: 4-(cytidine 5'-diphospho)-2-C-methyl-D-erythritol kinase [Melioribacter sp.]|nr:4-(cytidine 5'-diphospho)-2-C-methyl-D-erythritol kinase [Melioribacter sp.]